MTTDDVLARAQALRDHKPHIVYGHHGMDHAVWPWPPDDGKRHELDCAELLCLCFGVQKDDGPGGWPWWSANAIYHDATGPQKFWRLAEFGPGVGIVYAEKGMGHCGICTGDGTRARPKVIESRASDPAAWTKRKKGVKPIDDFGVWEGIRIGLWALKRAVFVVPKALAT
jgi:hypothetical protein